MTANASAPASLDGKGPGGRRRRGRGERMMVPEAEFTSYYGRPVVKPAPWSADIPGYFFLGGLAGGSSLLAAGADLTGRSALRRASRLTAVGGLLGSLALLVHDLGRPSRFHHMLRVAKPSSPMSVGTWLLTGYGPMAGVAAVSESAALLPAGSLLRRLVPPVGRGAGVVAAGVGSAVASYTAVLLSDTATPTWNAARKELPFVFVGSSAAAAGGMGLICAPTSEAAPARRMAVGGAVADLVADQVMERRMGLPAETLHHGAGGAWLKAAKGLNAAGVVLATAGRRNRVLSALSGAALVAGSVCTRFGIFHAGQESAKDPKYTVVPQRERLAARS